MLGRANPPLERWQRPARPRKVADLRTANPAPRIRLDARISLCLSEIVVARHHLEPEFIAKLIHSTIGMRASEEDETSGLDRAFHAETAYDFSAVGGSNSSARPAPAVPASGQQRDEATTDGRHSEKKVDA